MRTLQILAFIAGLVLAISSLAAQVSGPHTLEEALKELDKLLPAQAKEIFKRKRELEAILDAHLSLGMGIRNKWFRSGRSTLPGYLYSLGARHIDDMSSVVLGAYWRHLNGKPIEIEKYVEKLNGCFERLLEEQKRVLGKMKNNLNHEAPNFDCP